MFPCSCLLFLPIPFSSFLRISCPHFAFLFSPSLSISHLLLFFCSHFHSPSYLFQYLSVSSRSSILSSFHTLLPFSFRFFFLFPFPSRLHPIAFPFTFSIPLCPPVLLSHFSSNSLFLFSLPSHSSFPSRSHPFPFPPLLFSSFLPARWSPPSRLQRFRGLTHGS